MTATLGTAQDKARILVIDDDLELLRGVCLALSTQGYEATTLTSGADAMDVIAHVRPDVVILDVMMPGIDGWEVLRRIRSHPPTMTLPVLMLTAKDSEDAKVLGFSLGADDYLTKPFSVKEFRCRVGALLRRARAVVRTTDAQTVKVPVVSGSSGHEFIDARDIYYIEGIRNYTYVHTYDGRHLSRLPLGEMERRSPEHMMRVHRSFIANLDGVRGCRWANRSSYRLVLADQEGTEIPVSRNLVSDVQHRLSLK